MKGKHMEKLIEEYKLSRRPCFSRVVFTIVLIFLKLRILRLGTRKTQDHYKSYALLCFIFFYFGNSFRGLDPS